MRMNRRIAMLAIAAMALAARIGVAHDGHDHLIMGTVMARDGKHLEVKTPSGEVLSIAVTDKTTTLRDKKKIPYNDVQVGRRVAVNIGNGEDPLIAREIRLGAVLTQAASAGH